MTHTNFTKITRMEHIHVDSVVMLTTGKTTTTGMFPVLSNTTVTGGNVYKLIISEIVSIDRLALQDRNEKVE